MCAEKCCWGVGVDPGGHPHLQLRPLGLSSLIPFTVDKAELATGKEMEGRGGRRTGYAGPGSPRARDPISEKRGPGSQGRPPAPAPADLLFPSRASGEWRPGRPRRLQRALTSLGRRPCHL